MTEKTVLELKHVNKVYPSGVVGLDDINFTVHEGEFVAVVGLSGAGKSTLFNSINRMIDVTDGQVLVDGEDITKVHGKELRRMRRKIGMIFQNFNLVERTTVQKNVLAGRTGYYPTWKTLLGLYSKADQQQAVAQLDKVNMVKKLYRRADQLSGGQKQRVAIARTLMQDPTLVLADEPVASLDPKTSKGVMDDLYNLKKYERITVLVNLHSMALALKYADRIIGLRDGKVVYNKPIAEANEAELRDVYEHGRDD
ncbi:phosphonate ABC transporter ATP-binding protein [Fructilactobacillus myrtifloralis]|uniref:Phosphonate ABC transporter ATP-binding protein n=1 Tax=Fructilactobacillus myrtifloralis TaxID=2940301 RepID=A0ABY5BPR5_9LACO|nr:phosphonate ABC transporter ATP-binding protein [Fructilactobacillus myrtifloralis]USS85662.1 phosphonate ABC transporter ATP-binding protein [Fructilactobacillus myrtifloralis]